MFFMFWRKKSQPKVDETRKSTAPECAAVLILTMIAEHKPPFERLDTLDVEMDLDETNLEKMSMVGFAYKLLIYLNLLEEAFGKNYAEAVVTSCRESADRIKNDVDEKMRTSFLSDMVHIAFDALKPHLEHAYKYRQ
jgi:hypothetical protein